jgi:alkanesulfonate monooxygenase SsuD/methylene tetrahydromethanopterin reductase-like flavin-dependent oxidoreductase (luciferase family)
MRFGTFLMPSHPPERSLRDGIAWDLQCIRWADELGLDEVWVGEHHTLRWEPVTAPDLLLAQAALETDRVRLGTAGHLLPYMHPVALAHRVLQLDHMTGGRVNFAATISSTPSDHRLFGIEGGMDQSRRMSAEALEIIASVWAGEPFRHEGEFWSVDYEPGGPERDGPWLRPYQTPHPPISVPGMGPASPSLIRAGAKGYRPISFNVAEPIVEQHWAAYTQGAAQAGRTPDRLDWTILKDVFVADTDDEAKRWSLQSHLARFYREYHLPILRRLGYLGVLKHDPALQDDDVTLEYLADTCFLIGSPETVAARLTETYERLGGFGRVLVLGSDYSEDPQRWRHSLELLMTEVAPRVSHLGLPG